MRNQGLECAVINRSHSITRLAFEMASMIYGLNTSYRSRWCYTYCVVALQIANPSTTIHCLDLYSDYIQYIFRPKHEDSASSVGRASYFKQYREACPTDPAAAAAHAAYPAGVSSLLMIIPVTVMPIRSSSPIVLRPPRWYPWTTQDSIISFALVAICPKLDFSTTSGAVFISIEILHVLKVNVLGTL